MIDAWVAPILNRLKGIERKSDSLKEEVAKDSTVAKESTNQEIKTAAQEILSTIDIMNIVTKSEAEFLKQIHTDSMTFTPATGGTGSILFDDEYYYLPSETTLYVYARQNDELVASISQSSETLLSMSSAKQNEGYIICNGTYWEKNASNPCYGVTVISKQTLSIIFSARLSYSQSAYVYDVLTNPDNDNEIYFTYSSSGSRNNSYYLAKATMFTTTYTSITIPNYANYGTALQFFSYSRIYAEGEDLLFLIGGSKIFKLNRNNLSVSHGGILSCGMNTTLHIGQKYVLCSGNKLRCYDNNFDLTRKICFNPSLTIVSTAYINGLVVLNASHGITSTDNKNTCIVLNSDLTHIIKYYSGDIYAFCDGAHVYIEANGAFELIALTECNIDI